MHKQCFINFSFTFYVAIKKETIRKSNTGIAIFEILEFKRNMKQCVYIHSIYPLMTYRFICFIPKTSFMFQFCKTDAHICFTEYVLSKYCV